jgi:hypothetical protein
MSQRIGFGSFILENSWSSIPSIAAPIKTGERTVPPTDSPSYEYKNIYYILP